MKKILFAALALSGLLMTSCENDPIEITTVAPKHDVTLNVSTQAMYDQFGIANDIRSNFLNTGNKTIGVTAYVFDSVGVFIDKIQGTSSSMSVVKLDVDKLIEGEYTFVTIETLVDESTGKSDVWSFDSTEKITDMKISQTAIPAYQNVIGFNTQTINLKRDEAITIEPKAIGSMVNFNCYNFEESPFENLGFTTSFALSYYSLDPNLQRKDRFHLSQSGTSVIRGTISAADSKDAVLKIYLPEAEINWEYKYQNASDVAKNNWNSNGDNYGSSALDDGVTYEAGYYYLDNKEYYTNVFYGTSSELLKWKSELDEFIPYLHVVPYLDWNNGSVDAVKSYMRSFKVGNDGVIKQTTDGDYLLWYYGKWNEEEIDYYFTSNKEGLYLAIIFFDSSQVGEDFISKGLEINHFEYLWDVENEDGSIRKFYISEDLTNRMWWGMNSSGDWYLMFMQLNLTSSLAGNAKEEYYNCKVLENPLKGHKSAFAKSCIKK